jgi:hypothetical protein
MGYRVRWGGVLFVLALSTGSDLLACGDKFLVGGRGTRYQRPKNARAASVLLYANPSSGLPTALGKLPVESVLKQQGHRLTTAESLEQLSALLTGGRFDVILAASNVVAAIESLLGGKADAPQVVAFCIKGQPVADDVPCAVKAPPKERSLLEAIDKAVERHDRSARNSQPRG